MGHLTVTVLGVVEHFYEGYDVITSEMSRVLRYWYLFMIVPTPPPPENIYRERENILLGMEEKKRLRNFINCARCKPDCG